jgi:hypothetical protein
MQRSFTFQIVEIGLDMQLHQRDIILENYGKQEIFLSEALRLSMNLFCKYFPLPV